MGIRVALACTDGHRAHPAAWRTAHHTASQQPRHADHLRHRYPCRTPGESAVIAGGSGARSMSAGRALNTATAAAVTSSRQGSATGNTLVGAVVASALAASSSSLRRKLSAGGKVLGLGGKSVPGAASIQLPGLADMRADITAQQVWARQVMPPQMHRSAMVLLYMQVGEGWWRWWWRGACRGGGRGGEGALRAGSSCAACGVAQAGRASPPSHTYATHRNPSSPASPHSCA